MNQQTHAGKRLTWRTGSLTVALLGLGFVVLTLGLFSSCAKKMALEGGLDSAKMPASVEPAAAPRMEAEMAGEAASDPSAAMSIPFGSAAYAAEITRQIIYSADLTVEVQDVDVAAGSIESIVEAAGGWVSQKRVQEYTAGQRSCNITVRVPVARFADTYEAVRKCGRVLSEGIDTDDVTEEFVDLEARLKNLNREEGILLELFDRRGKVSDVLQVERELSRVRGEIERIQGRLKYLKDRVNYSTITAQLYTEHSEAVREMDKWDLRYHVLRAWRALVNVARALTYVVIYTAIVAGPFVVVALVIWGIVRAIRRRRPSEAELPPREDQEQ